MGLVIIRPVNRGGPERSFSAYGLRGRFDPPAFGGHPGRTEPAYQGHPYSPREIINSSFSTGYEFKYFEQLHPERVGELTTVYNDYVADVPLCDSVSVERFVGLWAWRDDQSAQLGAEQAIYAARENGCYPGFAHLALGHFPGPELQGDQQPGPTGVIRLITYPPGRRAVGQALLEAAYCV